MNLFDEIKKQSFWFIAIAEWICVSSFTKVNRFEPHQIEIKNNKKFVFRGKSDKKILLILFIIVIIGIITIFAE